MEKHHREQTSWLTLEGASRYSGLSKRAIQNYIAADYIVSSNVMMPGASRGRRLVNRESLDAFIEAGIDRGPASLKMNASRGGAKQ